MKITIPAEYQSFYEFTEGDFIRKYPDPILYKIAQPVTEFSDRIKKLSEDMENFVRNHDGCAGLAANQVGSLDRIFVMEYEDQVITLVNPEILESGENAPCMAGCMSFPFLSALNHYPSSMKVKFRDINGNEQIIHFEGFPSFCAQHEIDHLNGVLFIDKADPDSLTWETEEDRQERIERRKKTQR